MVFNIQDKYAQMNHIVCPDQRTAICLKITWWSVIISHVNQLQVCVPAWQRTCTHTHTLTHMHTRTHTRVMKHTLTLTSQTNITIIISWNPPRKLYASVIIYKLLHFIAVLLFIYKHNVCTTFECSLKQPFSKCTEDIPLFFILNF